MCRSKQNSYAYAVLAPQRQPAPSVLPQEHQPLIACAHRTTCQPPLCLLPRWGAWQPPQPAPVWLLLLLPRQLLPLARALARLRRQQPDLALLPLPAEPCPYRSCCTAGVEGIGGHECRGRSHKPASAARSSADLAAGGVASCAGSAADPNQPAALQRHLTLLQHLQGLQLPQKDTTMDTANHPSTLTTRARPPGRRSAAG